MARFLARSGGSVGFIDKSSYSKYFFDVMLPFWGRGTAPRLLEQKVLGAVHVPVGLEWMTFKHVAQPALLPRLGLEKNKYIVVHLFAGSEQRGLSPAVRQKLVDAVAKNFPDLPLVFTGTAKERDYIKHMQLPDNAKLVDTSVQEMAQLIEDSKGVVSVGTGPSHMASIMRKPLMVLVVCHGLAWCGVEQYGDAPITIFARPDLCPDGHNSVGYSRCMDAIDMDALATKAKQEFDK
jgi:ADP-heptose:LPS heptosyltransferase